MRFHTPGRQERCGSRLSTSADTTRRVPPCAVDGARTPVTAASVPPPTTGTSARPPAPPPQLTARTTTRTTTAAAARIRRRGQPRAHAGSRAVNRSRVCSTTCCSASTCAAGGQRPSAAVGGDPTDPYEFFGVQAGTADERAVDVRPGQDPGRVRGLHRTSVEDTDDRGRLRAESLGEPRPECSADLLR